MLGAVGPDFVAVTQFDTRKEALASALSGKVGDATACTIYPVRPEVCRTCMPGDPECAMARKRHGLPVLA